MRAVISFFSLFGRTRRAVFGAFSLATIPVFAIFAAAASVAVLQVYGHDIFSGKTPTDVDAMRSLAAFPHQAVVWTSVSSGIIWLVMCVTWIALSVRRLHDMGGTGWIAIAFVPLIFLFSVFGYLLVCLVLSVWPGTKGANRYGRDPRRPDDIAAVFANPGGDPKIVS